MTLYAFLSQLRQAGVELSSEGNRLAVRGSASAITPEIRAELTARKSEILAFLRELNHVVPPASPSTRSDRSEDVPLSFAQERLWFLSRLDPASAAYHVACAVRLNGLLGVRELEDAIGRIVARHDVLRTVLPDRMGVARATVRPYEGWQLPVVTLDGVSPERRLAAAVELSTDHAIRPFDLSNDAPFRALLLVYGHLHYELLLTFHHIAFDGASWGVFFRELEGHYRACLEGTVSKLPPCPIQYGDYADWERRGAAATSEADRDFWRQMFGGELTAFSVPTSGCGREERAALSVSTAEGAETFAQECQTTPFVVWLAAFAILLHRVSGQEDLIVGTPVSMRSRTEMQGLIGFFVNTLPLRVLVSPSLTFRGMVLRVRQIAAATWSRQSMPFERIVQEIAPERSADRVPLCPVLFAYQSEPVPRALSLPGVDTQVRPLDTGTAKFALSLDLRRVASGLELVLEHDVEWFDELGARAFVSRLERLASKLLGAPDRPIAEVSDLSIDETSRVLGDWAGSPSPPPSACGIHELFAACVARMPEATAVVHRQQRVSYRELDRRSEQIAGRLTEQGVAPGTIVGVCLRRRPDLVASLLAVLKAGAAYLPLDPAHPAARLASMIDDITPAVIVSERAVAAALPALPASIRVVDLEDVSGAECAAIAATHATAEDLAYVLFTSGSSGRPKAVAIEHRNTMGLLSWVRQTFSDAELAGVLAATPIGFDLAVFEIFGPLTCGGACVLADSLLDLEAFASTHIVTLINTVPTALKEMLRLGPLPRSVRTVTLAGEPLDATLVNRLHAHPHIERVFNLYGPTETTTYSAGEVVERGARPTLGRPLPHERIYVLDGSLHPVPPGSTGEICIGGVGVARGYLNDAAATRERFLSDPFSSDPGARLFRTGDFGRHRPDGRLEFIGRRDLQVKVRGVRVELEEVEAVLTRHESIAEAAVSCIGIDGARTLVAYVVPQGSATTAADDLRTFLSGTLPSAMLPSVFVWLDRLPRTATGKLDRHALPPPVLQQRRDGQTPPRTNVEAELLRICRAVLPIADIGVDDDLFRIGVHSLLATQIIARARDAFQIEIPLRAFFDTPTVAGLALTIERAAWQLRSRAGVSEAGGQRSATREQVEF
jgi:amino acid adenylation domain-containing protein